MKYLLIFLVVILGGCSVPYHIAKIEKKDPSALPNYCANRYPVKEFVRDSIIYKQGETVTKFDTVETFVKCDTVDRIIRVRVPCPTSSNRVDTVYREKESVQENTAKVTAVESENKDLTKKNTELTTKLKTMGKWLWVLGLISAIAIAFILYKIFK